MATEALVGRCPLARVALAGQEERQTTAILVMAALNGMAAAVAVGLVGIVALAGRVATTKAIPQPPLVRREPQDRGALLVVEAVPLGLTFLRLTKTIMALARVVAAVERALKEQGPAEPARLEQRITLTMPYSARMALGEVIVSSLLRTETYMVEALPLLCQDSYGSLVVIHLVPLSVLQKIQLAALEPSVLFGVLAVPIHLQPLTYDHSL